MSEEPDGPANAEWRKARALEIWKASASRASASLSDSLLAEVIKLAISDFGAIYKCARGYQIDPVYLTAFTYDILIALEAVAASERLPS